MLVDSLIVENFADLESVGAADKCPTDKSTGPRARTPGILRTLIRTLRWSHPLCIPVKIQEKNYAITIRYVIIKDAEKDRVFPSFRQTNYTSSDE